MESDTKPDAESKPESQWDHDSDQRFVDYYAHESLSEESIQRFSVLMDRILTVFGTESEKQRLDVADIGCGPGAQAMLWAEKGHVVHGLDINESFIELARERAAKKGLQIDYQVSSATQLPWDANSVDVCLVPELLEHVADWQSCLDEFARILRPNGVLFLSTSNKLCPVQKEFSLPLYSWYPTRLKRYFERLSVTTRPRLVNYAKYPAVNWFTYYILRSEFDRRNVRTLDRFDFAAMTSGGGKHDKILSIIRSSAVLRWIGQTFTPYSLIIGIKNN